MLSALVIRDLVDWLGWLTTLVSGCVLHACSLCSLHRFHIDVGIILFYFPALFELSNVAS